jgi:hypothetical protein
LIDAANFFAAELFDAIAAEGLRAASGFAADDRAVLTTTGDRLVSAALILAALANRAPPLPTASLFRLVFVRRVCAARCDFALAARAAVAFSGRRDRETGCFVAAFVAAGRALRDFLVMPDAVAAAAMIVAEDFFTPMAVFATRFLETCLICCFFLVFLVDDMS